MASLCPDVAGRREEMLLHPTQGVLDWIPHQRTAVLILWYFYSLDKNSPKARLQPQHSRLFMVYSPCTGVDRGEELVQLIYRSTG